MNTRKDFGAVKLELMLMMVNENVFDALHCKAFLKCCYSGPFVNLESDFIFVLSFTQAFANQSSISRRWNTCILHLLHYFWTGHQIGLLPANREEKVWINCNTTQSSLLLLVMLWTCHRHENMGYRIQSDMERLACTTKDVPRTRASIIFCNCLFHDEIAGFFS